jgi:hypothetical protein
MSELDPEPAPSRPRLRRRLLITIFGLLGLFVLAACEPIPGSELPPPTLNPACTKVWIGPANTAWSATTAWSPQGVPTASDVACSTAGSAIRVSGPTTVGSVLLAGSLLIEPTGRLDLAYNSAAGITDLRLEGKLVGDANLVLLGQPVLRGTFEGTGTRWIMPDANASVTGDLTVDGGTLDNFGIMAWSAGQIRVCDSTSFTNHYVLTSTNSAAAINGCGAGDLGTAANNASASFTTAPTGTTGINVPFDNDGLFSAPGAVVTVSQGSTAGQTDDGEWLPTGENITFSGGTRRFSKTAQVGGPDGTIHLAGAVFTGDTRINHPLRWTAGQLAGPSSDASIAAGVPVTINGSPVSIGAGAYVDNRGTTSLTTALSLCGDALWENHGPMTMSTVNAAILRCSPTDQPTFANHFELTATSANSNRLLISTLFDNYGDVINTTSAKLEISGGSTSGESDTGYYYPRGLEGIIFTGGVREFDSTAEVGLVGGSIGLNGATITGGLTATGEIRWNSGMVDGDLVVDNDWGGSLVADSGPITLGPFGYIEIINSVDDETRPLIFTLATTLRMCGNSVLYNDYATVRLNNASARIEPCGPGDQPSIVNSGTLVARPTSGETIVVDAALDNYDLVQVALGSSLELRRGNSIGGANFGDFGAYSGQGTLTFAGGTRKLTQWATVSGVNRLTGGALTGVPSISGTFEWAGGQLAGPGTTTTITGGTLNATGSLSLGAGATLINGATVNLSGTLNACAGGISIQNNKTVNLTGTGTISGCGTTTSSFVNGTAGTLNATPSGGNVEIGLPVTNTGALNVNSGATTNSLRVANFTQTAGTTTLQTATSRLQPLNGTATVSGGTLTGIGQLTGNLSLGGTLVTGLGTTIGNFTVTGNLTTTTGAVVDTAVNPTGPVIGRLQVNGTAALSGTMRVRFSATPATLPQTYQLLAASGGRSGTFATLTTTGLSAGVARSLGYTANAVTIVVG